MQRAGASFAPSGLDRCRGRPLFRENLTQQSVEFLCLISHNRNRRVQSVEVALLWVAVLHVVARSVRGVQPMRRRRR